MNGNTRKASEERSRLGNRKREGKPRMASEDECRRFLIVAGLVLTVLFLFGCKGPEGPQGEGVGTVDLVPPSIELVWPAANDTIRSALFTCEATASDNDGISSVEFFLDGSSSLGGDSQAVVTEPPYQLTWTLLGSGHGSGLHIFSARAVDTGGNTAWCAPIPLWVLRLFGEVELAYDDPNGNLLLLGLPDMYGDRDFNVRFSPRAPCDLLALRFRFADPFEYGYDGGVDMDVKIWSSDSLLPDQLLDTLRVTALEFDYLDWMEVDVSGMELHFEDDFHAGWSPDSLQYDDYFSSNMAALLYVTDMEDEPLKEQEKHRSILYQPGLGWETVQHNFGIRYDFHIRAVVDYGDGEPVLLEPVQPGARAADRDERGGW